ncbi:MAG: DNA-processing protein DprA [Gammaproteobacteria bacterium]|jgi:DNA processing protein|nr:DNA-processing protein DprA [Gammaproteobacteria bacterium]MDH5170901.1 DNA-processing protein DprA [Gammaproteobacteria bacterium]
MSAEEARLCLLLHSAPGIDDNLLARMLLSCGSPRELAAAGTSRWRELGLPPGTAQELAQTLRGDRRSFDIDGQLAMLTRVGAQVVPITDSRYPPLLQAIHDPPPLLYVRGDIAALSQPQLAVVGSRKASPAGLRAAGELAAQAVRAGLHITSGLALGIDGAAHRGALAAGGRSIAVVATGIEQAYPRRHRGLAAELEGAGCLVSEFPPGIPPRQYNFPRRNRIISGLALGVLVVEAALPSGSLITARTAVEQGREVCALPWSIYHGGGAGCLYLIRDGAKMVQTIGDVLEELGPMFALQRELLPARDVPQPEVAGLSGSQQRMLGLVGYESVTVDELVRSSAAPAAQVMADLAFLEIRGVVARTNGGFIRT